ncbi:ABC transporter ATP-binding protein [Aquimarina aggregata]|uniref:ABC transporter ATP-binding protein n=1 Tax=Aquimarina aggregata TaxID=1642818 RepID=A0A163AJ25_9FLAO|nr:peptidase domain-containing ABC transporter [Aquimarina aggregata]KZS40578.1 ABC transporter ATP-binding protein [Aquimarina aggregata]
MSFQFTHQHDNMDCGPACLSMVASSHGKNYPLKYLKENSSITREGVSLNGIREAGNDIGFDAIATKLNIEELKGRKDYFPAILHWNQNHFVVLRKVSKNIFTNKYYYHIADPAHGLIKLSEQKFLESWYSEDEDGIILFLIPREEFYEKEVVEKEEISIKYILSFLTPYRKQLTYMFLLLLFGSGLTLIFPFLTQMLIDKGVNAKDIDFIFIILSAQLGVFLGTITIDIFRNWLMLYIGTNLSITIISDFIKNILKLPIKFFDTKKKGDFIQRIQDNERIEEFLTSQSLTTFFSIITFVVFFGVFIYYDYKIFVVYLFLTVISVMWSFFWLKKRKRLDYYRFQQRSQDQESIYEIINGVTEMKINQFEDFKRLEWEKIQKKLFNLNIRILRINQIQISGFEFINQLKNIIVTFLAATFVVEGKMTLGALLSVSYIIGQMNSPIDQLISFFRSLQDAKLSLERLNEVQNHPTEEQDDQKKLQNIEAIKENGIKKGIRLVNVSFKYGTAIAPNILENVNLCIPEGKVTAIVGASGSGKTTLMKLLLRFYNPNNGKIFFNDTNILDLSPKSIRENCGVVMQDGYIFSDTIERNIATGDTDIDYKKLAYALKIANIEEYIESLPLKLKTKIGAAGNGISGGQQQRILIARAIYKNPRYIFFDEATSALDAENEKIIHDNLQGFFKNRTVVIIAHRLSTVKNADQIIVLKKGGIVEYGNHQELVSTKGDYYSLVKNQLELGS